MKRKKREEQEESKDRPLKHITVYFKEGTHKKYENPDTCLINERTNSLNIRLKNKNIVYNLDYLLAYEFEEDMSEEKGKVIIS